LFASETTIIGYLYAVIDAGAGAEDQGDDNEGDSSLESDLSIGGGMEKLLSRADIELGGAVWSGGTIPAAGTGTKITSKM
jgi:hypothetical protein